MVEKTEEELEYEEDFPNLTLAADITLTGENNWTPIGGKGEDGLLYYIGTINGGGHTWSNWRHYLNTFGKLLFK